MKTPRPVRSSKSSGGLRIAGGSFCGRKLFSPDNGKVRPTSERARQALFNILRSRLGSDFSRLNLLDLFAGSGAFGLEAYSRGFGHVLMIDLDPAPMQKNLRLFPQAADKVKAIRADAVRLPSAAGIVPGLAPADVLFCDAPYQQNLTVPALCALDSGGWLKPGALCLIEVEKNEKPDLPDHYVFLQERRYGLAKIILAEYQP